MKTHKGQNVSGYIDDHELMDKLYALLKNTTPLVQALEDERDAVLNEARAQWPVKTGRSKAGLRASKYLSTKELYIGIEDNVPYVYYIKGNEQGGRSTWKELVEKPLRKRIKPLRIRLADAIIEITKGG